MTINSKRCFSATLREFGEARKYQVNLAMKGSLLAAIKSVCRMDEQNITVGQLRKVMSCISEERWCAGWMSKLEHMLWDAGTGRRENLCTPEEIEQLKVLSGKCAGWIIWDEQAKNKRFVPMQDWLRLYESQRP